MKKGQQGAAILLAMLVVALVSTLAASAVWRQQLDVEVETAERGRMQARWVLTGALDWARTLLREDGRTSTVDHLGEPWAVPLQEARLSAFLAADAADEAGMPMAFLSGRLLDMQARLNVNDLANGGAPVPEVVAMFERLFDRLGLPRAELAALAAAVARADAGERAGADAPLPLWQLADLLDLGVGEATLQRLAPYVAVLPLRSPVNLNTAPPEVLYASLPGLEWADALRLALQRERKPFGSIRDAAAALSSPQAAALSPMLHGTSTRYFEATLRLRLDALELEERAVLFRNGLNVRPLWRRAGPAAAGQPDS